MEKCCIIIQTKVKRTRRVGTNPTLNACLEEKTVARIENEIENLIQNTVQDLGYSIYDVEYVKEGKDYFLRIFIENEKGITLEDCEKVNDGISDLLDEADLIKDQYYLEVSSTGIEKVLRKDKHFQKQLGNLIEVHLFKPLDGLKQMEGFLEKYDQDSIQIETNGEIKTLNRKDIALVKTKFDWDSLKEEN